MTRHLSRLTTDYFQRYFAATILLLVLSSGYLCNGARVLRAGGPHTRDGLIDAQLRIQPALRGGGLRRLLASQVHLRSSAGSGSNSSAAAAAGALHGDHMCIQLVLRLAVTEAFGSKRPLLSPHRQSGGRGALLDSGSCGRVQRLLVSDLTQAAAHLGIHVTQPFAPTACDLEPDQVAAAAGDGDMVLARWQVCGRPVADEDSGLVALALALQLQEAADSYYAAALGPDFDTCPTRLSGLVAALEVVRAPGTASECVTAAHLQPLTGPCSSVRVSAGASTVLVDDSSASGANSA